MYSWQREGRDRENALAIQLPRWESSALAAEKLFSFDYPLAGGLKALENRTTPRGQTWDPLLQGTGAPGIYFEDFPELAGFNCREWSHLSAGDSVEFSKRLVPAPSRRPRHVTIGQRAIAPFRTPHVLPLSS